MRRALLSIAVVLALGPGCVCSAGDKPKGGCVDLDFRVDGGYDDAYVYDSEGVYDTAAGEVGPCDHPLPSAFSCKAPTVPAGQHVCTDEAIEALLDCFPPGDPAKCIAAKAKFGACRACTIDWSSDKTELDVAACMQAIDPSDPCGTAIDCAFACVDEACSFCSAGPEVAACTDRSIDPGSLSLSSAPFVADTGADADDADGDASLDADETLDATFADALPDSDAATDSAPETGVGGVCYDKGGSIFRACITDPRFRGCAVDSRAALLIFTRGACRDDANWSKAKLPDGTGDPALEHDLFEDAGIDPGDAADAGAD